ncbi:type I polyketide synthase [Roseicyclus marinus]|uniref:type I polyketide synthase n=1 Tax=Roseicyclus marinus TaxID=2161673 RepID=UPI00240FDE2B|nr:type I polyketide synthase [Roseicyclus marinus]MDG3042752.1 SDR family NAD(P)-dependent oxidoreductase [Roseicyclus marinus]
MQSEASPDLHRFTSQPRPAFDCMTLLPARQIAAIKAVLVAQGKVILDARDGMSGLQTALRAAEDIGARDGVLITVEAGRDDILGMLCEAFADVGLILRCRDLDELDRVATLEHGGPCLVESGVFAVLEAAARVPSVSGLIAVGEEAGGWCGSEAAFILAQRMAALGRSLPELVPWFMRGATGPEGAGALALAGAAGVVLSDELILLPENGMERRVLRALDGADGTEAVVLGAPLGAPYRVFLHPSQPGARALEAEALRIEARGGDAGQTRTDWIAAVEAALAEATVRPMGQGIGIARALRDRYGRIGPVIATYRDAAQRVRSKASLLAAAIGPEAALAKEHGCAMPIVQGPMTRVSDRPGFAAAVAAAGGLPMLALAALRAEEIAPLLAEAKAQLDGKPWGVGMLGFLPTEQFAQQMEAVLAAAPPLAILAGGRADQVLRLEAEGIRTYVHTPTAQLARLMIDGGARRLILEGRECGGHVGPLHSMVLWETVATDLARHPAAKDLSILLAGGIHDGLSAAMAMAAAAPLLEAGAKLGVLMGTAYLSTRQLCEAGGIGAGFQSALIEATDTATIESGRGHSNRCLRTPFVDTFHAERRALLAKGTDPETMRDALDGLLLGRLRLASKGLERNDGTLVAVTPETQRAEGMFMAGEAASLITTTRDVEDLHRGVSKGAADLLAGIARRPASGLSGKDAVAARAAACDIAIIGMAVHVPGATDAQGFWRNILDKRGAISEIPADRWDHRVYSDDPDAPDCVTSRWGGFIEPMLFDPLRFGIPPKSVPHIAPGQLLTLEAVRRAFEDAGYAERDFDRENTSVVVGGEDAGGFLGNALTLRALAPLVTDAEGVAEIRDRTPGWTEETFPGVLTSVVAGRIANRFDLGGANYTIDSACASSITALAQAADELTSGRSNLVVLAGIDTTQTPYHYTAFSSVTALSRRGRLSAFDQSADGTVLAEGVAAFILKRRVDAERDGDRIYATIKAVASSSDGRGMGMTAPRPLGQKRALRRAYHALGSSIADIAYYEAHGTGTPVGDTAELDSVGSLMTEAGAAGESCVLGSVKALIGHTKTAAGAVGLAKVAMALHHRTLPPQPGIERPVGALGQAEFPLYFTDGPQPWLAEDRPRRAGISAFGFGGTNAHAVLEEHRAFGETLPGARRWPAHVVAVTGRSAEDLSRKWAMVRDLAAQPKGGPTLEEIAGAAMAQCDGEAGLRSVIVAESTTDLATQAARMIAHLADPVRALPDSAFLGETGPVPPLAFLFPGQGSQRPNMCREAAVYLPEMRESLEAAQVAALAGTGEKIGRILYPPAAFDAESKAAQAARLTQPQNAQIALGAVCAGLVDLLRRIGVAPDLVAGHSYGELVALYAAGAMGRAELMQLSVARGSAMAGAAPGAMCAVTAATDLVAEVIADHPEVVIANRNTPQQTVISGPSDAVRAAADALEAGGQSVRMLPVGGAFHSPLMTEAAAQFAKALDADMFRAPSCPVISARGGAAYPETPVGIADQLAAQMTEKVDWVAQVETLYEKGARVFLEVGPTGVLTQLATSVLGRAPDSAAETGGAAVEFLTLDDGRGLRGTLGTLARLWVRGYPVEMPELAPRTGQSLSGLAEAAARAVPKSAWLVDGMHIRPAHAPQPVAAAAATDGYDLRGIDAPPTPRAAPQAAHAPPIAQGEPMHPGAEDGLLKAYGEYQATMRQFLHTQEQVMNLLLSGTPGAAMPAATAAQALAAPSTPAVAPVAVTAPAPAPAPAPVAEPVAAAPAKADAAADRPAIAAMLRDTVADRTGYPDDMIAFDVDIEAEFGIDSIKRLEILERFIAGLPATAVEAFRADAERVARERVLDVWVEAAMAAIARTEGARPFDLGASGTEAATAPAPAPRSDICPAYRMVPRLSPLPEGDAPLRCGPVLVLRGPEDLTRAVTRALEDAGLPHATVDPDPARLPEAIAAARKTLGRIGGIVHLSGCAPPGAWPEATDIATKALFCAISDCLPELAASATKDGPERARIVALTRLGGLGGRAEAGGHAPADLASCAAGGVQGLFNSLTLEHPGIVTRGIDLAPEITDAAAAAILIGEMRFADGRVEVGHTAEGRVVLDVAPLEIGGTVHAPTLGPGSVILATGGVRGVTAATLKAIAAPGARIIALARRAEPEAEAPGLAEAGDAQALRRVLIAQGRAAGAIPRPQEIEARIEQILRDRAARRGLEDLRAHGFDVEVHAVDLCDRAATSALLDAALARHGRIDALVHGAGVVEDKLVADKTQASFDRVLGTKTRALDLLLTHEAAAGYRHVLFFSSIAGRLGNRGQADYGAANEILNRAALWFAATRPDVRVASINWGPWGGAGMASDAVNAQFVARGIHPIDLVAGAALANRALGNGAAPVELIAGRGDWMENLGAEAPPAQA